MLATKAGVTTLHVASPATGACSHALSTLVHHDEAVVRAALAGGDALTVLATVDLEPARDRSFAASLVRLAPHEPPETLASSVVYASRPYPLGAHVAVARGAAGPHEEGRFRVDRLGIDLVDVTSGASEELHAWTGYLLHVAGHAGDELIVYRVGPEAGPTGAEIVALSLATRRARRVASVPAFARDFSVDARGHRVVMQNRHPTERERWQVVSIDLTTGRASVLRESASMAQTPFALASGEVLVSDGRSGGSLDWSASHLRPTPGWQAAGEGSDRVDAVHDGGRYLAGLRFAPSRLPTPVLLERVTLGGRPAVTATRLPHPEGARVAIAGFAPRPVDAGGAP